MVGPSTGATDNVRRFLRADRGNMVKATKRLKDTLQWRREVRPETKMCGACLNVDLRSHYMQHCGWDRRGRALVFSDIGMARDKTPSTNAEHCMQVLELLEPSLAPFPNDQYIWVVDFHKFSMADMNPSVAGACLSLFGRSYPERLGGMIMVGAPMLFNGLFRAVAAFADPVTVKKVRFVKGPDGRGGGKPLRPVLDEFFDEETSDWLVAEMNENRKRWKELARRKSWLAATAAGDGRRHGWWEGEAKKHGSNGNSNSVGKNKNKSKNSGGGGGGGGGECKYSYTNGGGGGIGEGEGEAGGSGALAVELAVELAGGVVSEGGHDIRGCASFVQSAACARMCLHARRHAPRGELTRGAVLEAAKRAMGPAAPDEKSDDEEFFDAEDHCSTVTVHETTTALAH